MAPFRSQFHHKSQVSFSVEIWFKDLHMPASIWYFLLKMTESVGHRETTRSFYHKTKKPEWSEGYRLRTGSVRKQKQNPVTRTIDEPLICWCIKHKRKHARFLAYYPVDAALPIFFIEPTSTLALVPIQSKIQGNDQG